METLGEFLKDKRIKSNKSLENIAQETKIRKGLLVALENDQHDLLPPRVYLRGLLRAYAKEVGIDPEEVLDRYEAATADKTAAGRSGDLEKGKRRFSLRFYIIVSLIILTVLIIYFIIINRDLQNVLSPQTITPSNNPQEQTTSIPHTPTTIQKPAVLEEVVIPSAVTTVITAVTPTTKIRDESPPVSTGKFTIRFETKALTWIRIKADQEKSFDILLSPGESYQYSAAHTMKIRLGNAGGVSIFYNDTPLGRGGKTGEVVDLDFPEAAKKLQQEKQQVTPKPQA